jgi:opacity protein-like surface antigen
MKKLSLLFLLACSSPAWAQYGEIWFSAGQNLLGNSGLGTLAQVGGNKDDVKLEDGFRWGMRVTFNGDSYFGHEVQYAYNRTKLSLSGPNVTPQKLGMAVHMGGYNYVVYSNHEGTRVRPFATGGLGFANYVPPGSSAQQGGGSNKFGFNYGGGVKVRAIGSYALRLDVRQYTTPKPNFFASPLPLSGGWIRFNEISAGFGFVF